MGRRGGGKQSGAEQNGTGSDHQCKNSGFAYCAACPAGSAGTKDHAGSQAENWHYRRDRTRGSPRESTDDRRASDSASCSADSG